MHLSLSLLLLSLSSIAVLSQSKPAPPPFLNGLSDNAKREFGQIAGNKKITRLDLRNQVLKWAEGNGVKPAVEDYLAKKNKAKQAMRDRIQAAINNLPEAYRTLNALGDDDALTQEEADTKIKQTMAGYSWELKELLRLAGPGNQGKKPADAA